jgi:hypothetical protein
MAILLGTTQHTRRNMLNPTESHNGLFVAVTLPFLLLAIFFYVARIYSRIKPAVRLYWDDYTITLAFVWNLPSI